MLTEALETALNRNLPRSPRARELCAQLAGRTFRIGVNGTAWNVVLACDGVALRVPGTGPALRGAGEADAGVTGSLLALLELAGPDPQAVIRRGDVRISGDAELAQSFQELLALLRPDLEEELSQLVGDAPAHYAGRLARLALGFGRQAATTTVRNLSEYLSHERGDLVPRGEAESLFRGVEALREDLDRLDARLAALAAHAAASEDGA